MPAIVLSTQARFTRSVTTPGQYVFTLNFSDAYGRARATAGTVMVLTPAAHTGLYSSAGPALL